MPTRTSSDPDSARSIWIRLQLPASTHAVLKQQARDERRGLLEYLASILTDTAQGNASLAKPILSARSSYSMTKPSDEPLDQYVRDAQELALVGTTFRSLNPFRAFLEEKLSTGTSITFALADLGLLQRLPEVAKQVGVRQGVPASEVLVQLRETTDWLNELRSRFGESVTVVQLPVLPNFGLTIVDPFQPNAKLRVSLYLYRQPLECNPVLHIQPSTTESRLAFDLFMNHYVRLLTSAARTDILPPEESSGRGATSIDLPAWLRASESEASAPVGP